MTPFSLKWIILRIHCDLIHLLWIVNVWDDCPSVCHDSPRCVIEVCHSQIGAFDSCPVGHFSQGSQWCQGRSGRFRKPFFVRSNAFDVFVGSSIPSFWKWRFHGGKETDDGSFYGFANRRLRTVYRTAAALQIGLGTSWAHIAARGFCRNLRASRF